MKYLHAPRATSILYNLILSRSDPRYFLLPANICPIVPICLMKAEQAFRFIDISPTTFNMDQAAALDCVRRGEVAAILYSHTYGESSSPSDFFGEVKKLDPSIMLIDDRCLCPPDLAAPPTSHADVILYSTGYAKVVDLSYGGYAFLQEAVAYREVCQPFRSEDLEALERSYKSSIAAHSAFQYNDSDWLESGRLKLERKSYAQQIKAALKSSMQHKEALNRIYSDYLPPEIQLPAGMQIWRFQIRVPNPKPIMEAIFADSLFASNHYASLAGIMAPGSCPEAEILASQIINLFNDHHYTAEMAKQTCKIITGML